MLRPGFLPATAVAYALGVACAAYAGTLQASPWMLLGGLLVALCGHAAANVLNDYEDDRNGADAANRDAIAPFTGGAGLIQRGRATTAGTRRLAWWLALACAMLGLAIALQASPLLLVIGALGLLVGWAYSAPPLALMTRGVGEPAIALAWWLVVAGACTLAAGRPSALAITLGAGYGLLVAAILLINSFPDATADAAVGKRSLRVQLGADRAAAVFVGLQGCAHLLSALAALVWAMPWLLLAQLTVLSGLWASRHLWRHRHRPCALRPAIIATILTALLHGTLLTAGMLLHLPR